MNQEGNDNQPPQQGIPVMLVAQPIEENEINLFDIIRILIKRKGLVAAFVGGATIIGMLATFLVSTVYKTETTLTPIPLQDVQTLLLIDDSFSPQTLFATFSKGMMSKEVLRDYFLNHGAREKLYPEANTEQELRDAFENFKDLLQWKAGAVSITGSNPKLITGILNDLVMQTEKKIRDDMMADRLTRIQISISKAKQQLSDVQANNENNRLNRIAELQDALNIAKSLNIMDFWQPKADIGSSQDVKGISIATTQTPDYLRGVKSLQAELATLQNPSEKRLITSEEFALQQHIKRLEEQANIKADDFRLMRVDENAIEPQHPIKSKRKMILLGGLLLGLGLGILAAFLTEAMMRGRGSMRYKRAED